MSAWDVGYEYDPEKGDPEAGIEPGTSFEALPEDWICPECGVSKSEMISAVTRGQIGGRSMNGVRKVTEDLYWVGVNDKRIELFENIHPIPEGVSYNAYLLLDEKTVLF